MRNQQLFKIIQKLELCSYFDAAKGQIKLREADNLPFMRWPDGTPCSIANAYMINLLQRHLSRNNGGGTLRTYASDISHLIRFCYENKLDFYQMNNDKFTTFISQLRHERDLINPHARKRDSNTITNIGRTTLCFLDFIGRLNDDERFVIDTIQAGKRTHRTHLKNSPAGAIERSGWHHPSFDTPGPRRSYAAISNVSIQQLYDAIPKLSSNNIPPQIKRFIGRRRTIMIRISEMTGARIEETALIRIEDIEAALNASEPKLRLTTLKKRRKEQRFLPILLQDLAPIKAYLINRTSIVKQTIGVKNDHGFLFISAQTGSPLSSKYMSNEYGLLRKTAGIKTPACNHMFRTRFITKLFILLIKQYQFENKDEFRRALMDVNTLKQQVQQYTGHGNLHSLDTYIDLAFDELTNLRGIVGSVRLQSAYEAFDANVAILQRELENGLSITSFQERYNRLVQLRDADIERLSMLGNENIEQLE